MRCDAAAIPGGDQRVAVARHGGGIAKVGRFELHQNPRFSPCPAFVRAEAHADSGDVAHAESEQDAAVRQGAQMARVLRGPVSTPRSSHVRPSFSDMKSCSPTSGVKPPTSPSVRATARNRPERSRRRAVSPQCRSLITADLVQVRPSSSLNTTQAVPPSW